jgi:hypothetical protein
LEGGEGTGQGKVINRKGRKEIGHTRRFGKLPIEQDLRLHVLVLNRVLVEVRQDEVVQCRVLGGWGSGGSFCGLFLLKLVLLLPILVLLLLARLIYREGLCIDLWRDGGYRGREPEAWERRRAVEDGRGRGEAGRWGEDERGVIWWRGWS